MRQAERAATAQALFGLGLVYQVLHSDWTSAMPYFWQAFELVDADHADTGLYLRSEVHRHVGFYFLVADEQPAEAVLHLQLSLDLREQLGDPRRIPSGQVALAQAELAAGHRDRAIELLRAAVLQAREAGLLAQRIEDAERALREAEPPQKPALRILTPPRDPMATRPLTASPLRQAVPAIEGTSDPDIVSARFPGSRDQRPPERACHR